MKITDFKKGDEVKIVDVDKIQYGDNFWENGDVVEVRDVDEYENRIELWNKNKYLSELLYEHELRGLEIIK